MPTVVNNLQIVLQSPPSAAGRRAADQVVADALTSVLSDNTRRVYKTQWRLFTDWCGDVGLRSLLADALTVARYLAVRAGDGAALSPCALHRSPPSTRSPVTSTDPALAPVSPRARRSIPDCGSAELALPGIASAVWQSPWCNMGVAHRRAWRHPNDHLSRDCQPALLRR